MQAAEQVATHLIATSRGINPQPYDRRMIAAFQKLAGLEVDGIYGPQTAGAIAHLTGKRIPPRAYGRYQPTPRTKPQAAVKAAQALAAHLSKVRGKRYDRKLVKRFQRLAGLKPDGIYGPKTAGALAWYTRARIPPRSGYAKYVPSRGARNVQ